MAQKVIEMTPLDLIRPNFQRSKNTIHWKFDISSLGMVVFDQHYPVE